MWNSGLKKTPTEGTGSEQMAGMEELQKTLTKKAVLIKNFQVAKVMSMILTGWYGAPARNKTAFYYKSWMSYV